MCFEVVGPGYSQKCEYGIYNIAEILNKFLQVKQTILWNKIELLLHNFYPYKGQSARPGINGFSGQPGQIGDIGEIGSKGETGISGLPGINKTNGSDGKPGNQGISGPLGIMGDRGTYYIIIFISYVLYHHVTYIINYNSLWK